MYPAEGHASAGARERVDQGDAGAELQQTRTIEECNVERGDELGERGDPASEPHRVADEKRRDSQRIH
jgi:hypothetical protein